MSSLSRVAARRTEFRSHGILKSDRPRKLGDAGSSPVGRATFTETLPPDRAVRPQDSFGATCPSRKPMPVRLGSRGQGKGTGDSRRSRVVAQLSRQPTGRLLIAAFRELDVRGTNLGILSVIKMHPQPLADAKVRWQQTLRRCLPSIAMVKTTGARESHNFGVR